MGVGIGAVASGPVLQTERLELRLPGSADLAAMFAIVSDPVTGRYLGSTDAMPEHFARFLRNAGSWLVYGYGSFMVRLHDSDTVIGSIGIFHSWRGLGEDFDDGPEAGWIVDGAHAGQGIAREAMEAVLQWFEHMHGPRRIVALIEPENAASLSLADRLGFTPVREADLPDGARVILLERLPSP
jgi:RimJ/RimL family protein N-acetyltransferase